MTISTKFNIGDEVWFWKRDNAQNGIVDSIATDSTIRKDEVFYYIKPLKDWLMEPELFSSKQSLLDSLK